MYISKLLLIMLLLLQLVLSSKILILPATIIGYMSQKVHLIEELIDRGHDVYALIGSKSKFQRNIVNHTKVKFIEFEQTNDLSLQDIILQEVNKGIRLDRLLDAMPLAKVGQDQFTAMCQDIWTNQTVIDLLRNHKFDLIYVDLIPLGPCLLQIPYNLSVSFVIETSQLFHWWHGLPALPSFVPIAIFQLSDTMTFIERFVNLVTYVSIHTMMLSYNERLDRLLHYHTPGIDSWITLIRKSSFLVINRDHSLDWPQPVNPNTLFVPGLTYSPAKKLPKPIQLFIENCRKGIIYVSFGSMLNKLDPKFLSETLKACSQLTEYNTIVSYGGSISELDISSENILFLKWAPQNDILGHPMTKLFINHAGLKGQSESIYHGVPMLNLPITFEQHHSAYRSLKHGYGLTLDFYTSNFQDIKQSAIEILTNLTYQENAKHMSDIMQDGPLPQELVANKIEHLIKFGSEHLRPASMDMPLHQMLMLDVILTLEICIIVFLWLMYHLLKKLCACTKPFFVKCANKISVKNKVYKSYILDKTD